ncbi:MAG TPA: hypothetical protein VMQ11_05335 [Alphaproteobacteria bacterium]|nr:hypothetical protein [Alphaproteobacteria bacterium]
MPIEVMSIAAGRVRLWKHIGRVTLNDCLFAISDTAARHLGETSAHDLLLYAPGAYADLTADDLRRIIDAVVVAFPGRYQGNVKCAIIVGRLNYGITKLFCAFLDEERRIDIPAFVFVSCRHALEWLGFRNSDINGILEEIGPGPWEPD